MYDNYIEYEEDYENNNYPVRTINFKKYLVYIIILLIIVIGFVIYRSMKSYSFYEKKLVSAASKYVKSNHISTNQEIFLDSTKLKVKLPSNCSLLSGVIYDGKYYQPLLSCNDYQSNVVKTKLNDIALLGDSVNILLKGMSFDDPGFVSNKKVVTNGSVGTEEGVYNINYFVNNQFISRKVIIVDNPILLREYPTITINGKKEITIEKGKDYQDNGAKASDSIDGDITNKIETINLFDKNNAGKYKIIYKVTNNRGYTISKIRTVIVVGDDESSIISSLNTENITNQNVKIIFNILNTNYSSTILPNGEQTINRNFEYEVTENGFYEFKINDKYGNMISRKVEVKNIDKEAPKVSCVVGVYPNRKEIQVINESQKKLSKYKYIIDGVVKSETINNKYPLSNQVFQKAEVEVTDSIGNVAKVSCESKIMDPTTGNTHIKYYKYNNEEYVVANTLNNLDDFHSNVCRKIAQVKDKTNCGDACLSFAEYYAAFIQRGDMSKMNMKNACNYYYGGLATFKIMGNATKKDALKMLYNEIINGRVAVLQVTGTKARNSRHFYTIVGYKRNKYDPNDLEEEDLLAIDAWTGCFATLSYNDLDKRTMFDNKDGYGYRVNLIQ